MGKVMKSVSTPISRTNKRKSSTVKKSKKRQVSSTAAFRSLYNRYGQSKLVKHSKYVSRTECYVALYLAQFYTVIQQYKIPQSPHVFDIYIPKYNLMIEYDGDRWHKDKKHDREIDKVAIANGYRILRIKESKYLSEGRLAYVKKCMSYYDQSMMTKHLTTFQKGLLKDFWK